MQNGPKPARPASRLDTLAAQLRERLDNEDAVVDLLVGAVAKGQSHPELWALLHEAARRDERLAELAFVYERLTSERRFKTLAPAAQAEILMHVAAFFAEDFGDAEGAIGHLQRVLTAVPAHAAAFDKLEGLLVAQGDGLRLSELYASAAPHRATREEQLRLLRRAIELVDGFDAEEERAIRLYQQYLKLDPAHGGMRRALEARYERAGKFAELARMLEQALLTDGAAAGPRSDGAAGPESDHDPLSLRRRLVAVYAEQLHELERAMPHVEEVLRQDPGDERARSTAEQLLRHKPLAVRAATALEAVYERAGKIGEAAQVLAVQIDHLRGPRRVEAQKRLASLLFNRLGDLQGAFGVCEAVVSVDPADEDIRQRYRMLATSLDRRADAVRVLGRAASGTKDPALRARVACEVADLCLELGDVKKAKASYQSVLESAADEAAALRAAHALVPLCEDPREQRVLALALERISDLEPGTEGRLAAAERLARLSEGDLRDPKGAIAAWRKLLGTAREPTALVALEALYAATSAPLELAAVLEKRASLERDRDAARAFAVRAAELWSKSGDRAASLAAWRRTVESFGPSQEAYAALMPLLEQERQWDELADVLRSAASLASERDSVPLLVKLAQLRASRLHDPAGALDAYRQVLAIDSGDRTSRQAVERMLASGDQRLAAAEILERIYRADRDAAMPKQQSIPTAGLVRVLDVRATLSESGRERLAALEEALSLVEEDLKDPKQALDLVARALTIAVEFDVDAIPVWLERMDRLGAAADATRRAAIFADALGERAVEHPALANLARRAGEALALAGDTERALAIYRRALAFEPSSPDLLARVDTLLREQGSPAERVALYRTALDQQADRARRRELLHAIGAIERRELGDLAAATATYRQALTEDAADRVAHDALLETYQAAQAWEPLYEELTRGLEGAHGEEQKALILRMAEVAAISGRPDRAAAHYREILRSEGAVLTEAVLDAIERIASNENSPELLRDVFERRVTLATEPEDEAEWLVRLGELYAGPLGDATAAVARLRRAAQLLDGVPERAERGLTTWERVLALAPDDLEAAERVVALAERLDAWPRTTAAHRTLVRGATDAARAIDRLLAFETAAIRAAAASAFEEAASEVLSRDLDSAQVIAVRAARARVLAATPERDEDAVLAFRELIEAAGNDAAPYADAFQVFLDARKTAPERHADRRWLFAWRVEHVPEPERVRALLAWASAEHEVLADARAASDLYARVLEIDPDHEQAAAARTRLLLDLGDLEGAAALLVARRDRSEGPSRIALELELADLFIARLRRPAEALGSLAAVLDTTPADPNALALLERALEHPQARVEAARMFERLVDAAEDPEHAAALLDRLFATPAHAADLRPLRPGWYERLLDRAPDAEHALDVALRAVRELPTELALWDRAERHARELGRPDGVGAAYRAALEDPSSLMTEPGALDAVGRRAVEYHEEWFDDSATVARLLRRIVSADPESSWAFDRLKLTYNAAERWDELFQLYDEMLARAPDERARVQLLEEAAEAAKDLAGDAERAMGYLAQLLSIRRDARAAATLERLYERHGKHRPLVALLEEQLRATLEGEAAQRLRVRIASVYVDGLQDADAAVDVIDQMRNVDPNRAEAFDLLERVLAIPGPRGPSDTSSGRQRAAAILKARYTGAGRTRDVVRMIEVQLEAVANKKERARQLREVLKLRLELGDESGALDTVATLVALEPRSAEHRKELARLANRTGRTDRHADVLASVAEALEDRKLKRELLSEATALYRDAVGDPARAAETALAAFALAKDNKRAELEIGRQLEPLLAMQQRWAERCDVLERLSELETDPAARRALLGELARCAATSLGDGDRSIKAWSTRLDADASDVEALDGLAQAMEDRGRWRELLDVLERRSKLVDRVAARRDRAAAARVRGHRLAEVDAAIQAWRSVISEFGPDEESYDELAALLERSGATAELIALLEQAWSEQSATEARRAGIARKLGDVHRTSGSRVEDAVAWYEAALAHDPADAAARKGLEAVVDRLRAPADASAPRAGDAPAELRRAVEVLCTAYARSGDEARIAALVEPRLEAARDDAERGAVLRHTATILERHASAREAFDAVWRAFALEPLHEHVADVARLASEADAWADVAAAIEPLAARPDAAPAAMRDLFHQVGVWHRDRRQDPESAEAAFARAVSFDTGAVDSLVALADLQRRSRGRPLVDTLLRLSQATGGDLALLREAAELALTHVRDRELAKTVLESMLDLASGRWLDEAEGSAPTTAGETALLDGTGVHATPPADAARWAFDLLLRILQKEGDNPAIIEVSLRAARLPFPPSERRSLRIAAAELADAERAAAIYRELFDEDPSDATVRDRLEELYRRLGAPTEMLAMRERQLAVTATMAERAMLRLEVAQLLADGGDVARAIAALERNLEETPTHADTVQRLADLYGSGGQGDRLVALWEDQARRRRDAGDASGAAELWCRAAAVAESKLGDVTRAIAAHRAAADAGKLDAFDALARLHASRGEHGLAAEALEALRERSDVDALGPVVLRLADAYVGGALPERARTRLEEALVALEEGARPRGIPHPRIEHAIAVRARLAELYREAELWGPLATLLAADAARAPDRMTRVARLREAALLHLERRDDAAAAIPLIEQASDLDPNDLDLRFELCRALGRAGRADDAAAKLRALVDAYGARRPKERALVHYELAKLALAGGDRAGALAELDVAVRIDPAHAEILSALAKLALDEGQLERAHRTYRALLLVARRGEQGTPGPSRAEVLLALSDVAARQGDTTRAAEYLDSAFDSARESAIDRDTLVRSLRERGEHETLAKALEARLVAPTDAADATAILTELATLYDEHLARPDDAMAARLRALALAPSSAAVHEAALESCRRTSQVARYVDAVAKLVDEAAEPAQRAALLVFLGRALETDAYDDARAADAYRRAEELIDVATAASNPVAHEIWRALERIYARLGDVNARAEVLERRVRAMVTAPVPAPERADPLYELAAIRLADATTRPRGGELLDRAMEIDPRPDRAEAMLRDAAGAHPDETILRLLERFARTTGRRSVVVETLMLRAELADDRAAQAELLKEAYALTRELGDRALTDSILRRVLGEGADRPPEVDRRWALLALAELRQADGDLAEVAALKERAAQVSEPDEQRGLLLEVAELAAGPLGDLERAVRIYDELRRADPADRRAWEPLAEVYRRLGERARLVELIEETVPLLDALEDRGKLRLEEAKLVLDDEPDRGATLLRDILFEDPSQTAAAILLSGMLEKAGRLDELADLLASQLDSAKDREDTASITSLSIRLGALLEQRDDAPGALDVYRAALDWDPACREALRGVLRMTRRWGDPTEIAEALERLLVVEDGDEAAVIAIELADLRSQAGDEPGAERVLEVGFDAAPGNASVKEQLVARLTSRSAWRKVVELHMKDASRRDSPEERVELLCTAANVLRQHTDDPRGAADILERARALAPTDRDVLLALIDAYGAFGDHRRALAALSDALVHAPEDAWLYRCRATVQQAIGDQDGALADLEAAYDRSGGSYADELVAQLERALGRVATPSAPPTRPRTIPPPFPKGGARAPRPATVPPPRPVATAAAASPVERTLRLRLAQVLTRSGDVNRAREQLADLVRRDGKDRGALRALAALEETAGRWDAASAALRRLIALEEGEALVDTALRLADACEKSDRLGDARTGLERALRVAPGHAKVRERLRTVYNVTGASRELAMLILEDATHAPDVAGRFTLLLHAGRLLVESEDATGKAASVLEEARKLRPEEQEVTILLASAYATSGRRADGRALLTTAIAAHKGRRSKALAALYHAMSRIDLGEGNLTDALNHLLRAFENDPHSAALAMELGLFAIDLDDQEIASRAFRSITLMKSHGAAGDGPTGAHKALAYYHLGNIARNQGDRRKARLMAEKAVSEDPSLEMARSLLDELRARN